MIDMHQTEAEASGARIVPCCGFDSIPSDLGVFFLNEEVRKITGRPCVDPHAGRLRAAVSAAARSTA
jgi:short subunit dehydrogenase-like uncharacterized protein